MRSWRHLRMSARRRPRRAPGLRVPTRATRRHWRRRLRRRPAAWRVVIACVIVTAVALGINGVYQVARKPTELFFPVSGVLAKTPAETWREYGPAFRRYATPTID